MDTSHSTHYYRKKNSRSTLRFENQSTGLKAKRIHPVKGASHFSPAHSSLKSSSYNPYLNSVNSSSSHSFNRSRKKRSGLSLTRRSFLVLGGLTGIGLATYGVTSFLHIVSVTVNGQKLNVSPNSSIEDLLHKIGCSPAKGNFVSVAGNIIKKNEGYPWLALINDKTIRPGDSFSLKNGDVITIKDGDNKLEPHDTDYKLIDPQVKYAGAKWGAIRFISQWPQAGKQEIYHGKLSGETAPGKEITKLQDLVITTAQINPKSQQPLVALTFDDGPSAFTPKYLDILKQKNAKATFFCIARQIQESPQLFKRAIDEGHQVASHTYDHKDLARIEAEHVQSELSKAADIMSSTAQVKTTILRPPYGSFTNKTWWEAQGLCTSTILWTHDTEDWKQPGAEKIKNAALKNLRNGSIILMHDGGGPRNQDLQVLSDIIDHIQSSGFKLVTISELMASDPTFPKEIANGSAKRPEHIDWPKSDKPIKV